jgi:hypothetical protein
LLPQLQRSFLNHRFIIPELNGISSRLGEGAIANSKWHPNDRQRIGWEWNWPLACLEDRFAGLLKDARNMPLALSATFREGEEHTQFAIEQRIGWIVHRVDIPNQPHDRDTAVVGAIGSPVVAQQHVSNDRRQCHSLLLFLATTILTWVLEPTIVSCCRNHASPHHRRENSRSTTLHPCSWSREVHDFQSILCDVGVVGYIFGS